MPVSRARAPCLCAPFVLLPFLSPLSSLPLRALRRLQHSPRWPFDMRSDPVLSRLYAVSLDGASCSRARQNAVLLLRDYAASLGLELSDSDKVQQSTTNARLSIPDAAFAFLTCRTNATFTRLLCALHSVDSAILSESDKMPANLLNPAAHAPEIPAFHLKSIPPGSLAWQTHPAIGTDPSFVAMLQQTAESARKARLASSKPVPAKPVDHVESARKARLASSKPVPAKPVRSPLKLAAKPVRSLLKLPAKPVCSPLKLAALVSRFS